MASRKYSVAAGASGRGTHRGDRHATSHLEHLILLAALEPVPHLTNELVRDADRRLGPVERRRPDEVVVGDAGDARVLPFLPALKASERLREERARLVRERRWRAAREVAAVEQVVG